MAFEQESEKKSNSWIFPLWEFVGIFYHWLQMTLPILRYITLGKILAYSSIGASASAGGSALGSVLGSSASATSSAFSSAGASPSVSALSSESSTGASVSVPSSTAEMKLK